MSIPGCWGFALFFVTACSSKLDFPTVSYKAFAFTCGYFVARLELRTKDAKLAR